jgi:hypothetical protein
MVVSEYLKMNKTWEGIHHHQETGPSPSWSNDPCKVDI